MTDEFLSVSELRAIAPGRSRADQCEKLRELGVPYQMPGARILVSRFHARQWLLGVTLKQPVGPRLDLVR